MEYPVFICDDEQEQIDQMQDILCRAEMILSDDETIEFKIFSETTYEGAKSFLLENKFDGGIYFLDVELGREVNQDNGFDLAELIKNQDERAQIIFVTSHEDLSIITYRRRLGPVDYIVKTENLDELRKRIVGTVELAIDHLHKFNYMKKMTFSYRVGRQIRNMNIDDIVYITTTVVPHKLLIVKRSGEAQFLGSINKCAEDNPLLEKISQSCLVNPKNIEEIDLKKHLVSFVNGDVEEYSRSNQKKIKQMLEKYNYNLSKLSK